MNLKARGVDLTAEEVKNELVGERVAGLIGKGISSFSLASTYFNKNLLLLYRPQWGKATPNQKGLPDSSGSPGSQGSVFLFFARFFFSSSSSLLSVFASASAPHTHFLYSIHFHQGSSSSGGGMLWRSKAMRNERTSGFYMHTRSHSAVGKYVESEMLFIHLQHSILLQ